MKRKVTKEEVTAFKEVLSIVSKIDLGDSDQAVFIVFKAKNKVGAMVNGDKNSVLAMLMSATDENEEMSKIMMESSLLTGLRKAIELHEMEVHKKQGRVARD